MTTLRHGDLVEHPGTAGDLGTIVAEYRPRARAQASMSLCVIWHECLQRPWPEDGGCHVDAVAHDGAWEYGEPGERLRLVLRAASDELAAERVARARAALHATMRACEDDADDDTLAEAELAWGALVGVRP